MQLPYPEDGGYCWKVPIPEGHEDPGSKTWALTLLLLVSVGVGSMGPCLVHCVYVCIYMWYVGVPDHGIHAKGLWLGFQIRAGGQLIGVVLWPVLKP